jgi:tRNA(adenine34) deaminase
VASVLAHSNGGLVARAVHVVERNRFHLDHAPLRAFRAVKEACPRDTRDLVLATTLEPCVMCTGAAVELQVEVLVYGLRVPTDRGTNRVAPPTRPGKRMPRIIGGILETEIRTLLRECRCPSEIHQDRRMTDIARDHSSV